MISYIITAEGRLTYNDELGIYNYEYYLQDHLGNTRVVFNQNNEVLQTNSYYPFGMNIESLTTNNQTLSPKNLYLYNGKELQEDFNLNWHDYGARFYDAQIGRWHVIDPMTESYYSMSPYNYVANDTISTIDPNGMWGVVVNENDDGQKQIKFQKDDKKDDWKTFRNQSGMNNKEMRTAFGFETQKEMKNGFSAKVGDTFGKDKFVGGNYGAMLGGMEDALNATDLSGNCHGSSTGSQNLLAGDKNASIIGNNKDRSDLVGELVGENNTYKGYETPKMGDIVTFSNGGALDTYSNPSHSATVLLKKGKELTLFT